MNKVYFSLAIFSRVRGVHFSKYYLVPLHWETCTLFIVLFGVPSIVLSTDFISFGMLLVIVKIVVLYIIQNF